MQALPTLGPQVETVTYTGLFGAPGFGCAYQALTSIFGRQFFVYDPVLMTTAQNRFQLEVIEDAYAIGPKLQQS